jgi:hypothetical protein
MFKLLFSKQLKHHKPFKTSDSIDIIYNIIFNYIIFIIYFLKIILLYEF